MTLTLSRPDNTFDGFVYLEQGVLEVTKLANLGEPSSLGQPTNAAGNVIRFSNFYGNHTSGQTLRYVGDTASVTDRTLEISYLGETGNILDASGLTPDATVTFTADTVGDGNLTLTGDNTGDNTFLGDIGGSGSLTKTGPARGFSPASRVIPATRSSMAARWWPIPSSIRRMLRSAAAN